MEKKIVVRGNWFQIIHKRGREGEKTEIARS